MEYDFRTRTAPAYRPTGAAAGTASTMYPRVGQPGAPPPARAPYHNSTSLSPQSGLGIRVTIKPEYQIRPPPPLAAQMPDIPRSTFQFDFDFERRILAEAEKETQNWGKIAEPQTSKTASTSMVPAGDPLVDKYVASGLGREAVSLAVLNYGDNPIKVREFVKGYNLLREMGFSSKNVAEALAMYDNDTDKALAHFLNSPS